jgi:hypothetical protein
MQKRTISVKINKTNVLTFHDYECYFSQVVLLLLPALLLLLLLLALLLLWPLLLLLLLLLLLMKIMMMLLQPNSLLQPILDGREELNFMPFSPGVNYTGREGCGMWYFLLH